MLGCFVGWLVGWLVGRLVGKLFRWFVSLVVNPLVGWFCGRAVERFGWVFGKLISFRVRFYTLERCWALLPTSGEPLLVFPMKQQAVWW